jgi:hypothetical protein
VGRQAARQGAPTDEDQRGFEEREAQGVGGTGPLDRRTERFKMRTRDAGEAPGETENR